jgi:hypothetical protein
MSDIILAEASPLPLPMARVEVRIRPGTDADIDSIDRLQKQNHKQLGFMNRPTLEGKVKLGHVLVAETSAATLAGYLIGNDRYKHRDELGVIFQMCVASEYRRSLVAANLLKAQFERSAYGCRLYCCWCAQDIEANRFWESMGFVPIAFRAGSALKDRVHIFWQKRIREGDTTTPWWFPSETSGGLMDAARIALPIPPGMTWQDELPRLLPQELPIDSCQLPVEKKPRARKISHRAAGGLFFGAQKVVEAELAKPKRVKAPKRNDPVLAAKARELRDRWLEKVNENPSLLPVGKYDVARAIGTNVVPNVLLALPIAA